MLEQVRQADDVGKLLREYARRIDCDPSAYRWSYYRDFGKTRLVMMDSCAARVLATRDMIERKGFVKPWIWDTGARFSARSNSLRAC